MRAKNQIPGAARNDLLGLVVVVEEATGVAGIARAAPMAKLRLELAIEVQGLDARITRIEKELQKYADRHPAVKLLMTIGGGHPHRRDVRSLGG